ncbi:Polyketide biosynthesis protein BaeE [Bacillus subtilis]|uniref:ACP S-malonyltransferase n=1 Tax=Bacillus spizizenii TaxID=96241 RepID=UPI0006A8DF81|nr:ACP S-malonyltransferase [Bacillus spizizenii]OWV37189.1 [acyl-carrier-protein] S-malonyltransferase [Bacillus spizizenii]CUB39712.1 Polyketide biosynthesis protein BaeE [Bacillus subtilis]
MQKSNIFMFSGQGSQYWGMGKQLFRTDTVFWETMHRLDAVAIELKGYSIIEYIYDEKRRNSNFSNILYSHPAIYMIGYAAAQTLIQKGIEPDGVIGMSLGEFAAGAVAGILSPEDTMECVLKQAETLEKYCQQGGMMAVLGEPLLYETEDFLRRNTSLVSVNGRNHFVISGEINELEQVSSLMQKKGIVSQKLPVCFGFHSELIDGAARKFKEYMKHIVLKKPNITFISSLYGKELKNIPENYYWDVIREPIRFLDAVDFNEKRNPAFYIDISPSGSLAGIAEESAADYSKSSFHAMLSPFGNEINRMGQIIKRIEEQRQKYGTGGEKQMLAYVFPGQGAQFKGMGGDIFNEFSDLVHRADAILGYSIKDLCLSDIDNKLTDTKYTQPAIYTVSALQYLKLKKEGKASPDFTAGHSLGEYTALFAAGVFDFETGLKLVAKRGELMSASSQGGMAAVIGLNENKIREVLKQFNFDQIDIANYNTSSQIVIAGAVEDIKRAAVYFEQAGATAYVVLKVGGAFHSRFMEDAKKHFAKFIEPFQFSKLNIPVISNYLARPYKQEDIKHNLIEQITHSVKWTESIRYLMGQGVTAFKEVGPGNILTKLTQTIQKNELPIIINAPEVVDSIPEDDDINAGIELTAETIPEKGSTEENTPESQLGDQSFKNNYNLKYAYLAGGMHRGISSAEMIIRLGEKGMMGFFGTAGLEIEDIEQAIISIKNGLEKNQFYGMNIQSEPDNQDKEKQLIDLYIKHDVRVIEASSYLSVNEALIYYKAQQLKEDKDGQVMPYNRIIAKVSRPEVAAAFLSPAPANIVEKMAEQGILTSQQVEWLSRIPVAEDMIIEADSGSHTDQGALSVMLPFFMRMRDDLMKTNNYKKRIRIGAAGGIGTPEAAASAFLMGADFVMTGSINQCTAESGTSESVKELLSEIEIQDTAYAPSEAMFEYGAKVQVMKRGMLFPVRANKLQQLYQQFQSLDEIDDKTKIQLETKYFKKTFDEIYEDIKRTYPNLVEKADHNPKFKMLLIFKWYLRKASLFALEGDEKRRVDYQVHCGPSLGAFNQWVKGTELEAWRNRHVGEIGEKIMIEAENLLRHRLNTIFQ